MTNLKNILTAALFFVTTGLFAQTKTETTKVWGNCETCEKKIEKAAKTAGAEKAKWNMNKKELVVSYDSTKTTMDDIQKRIASFGYDTEKYAADDKAYNKLDECCKYKRKAQ